MLTQQNRPLVFAYIRLGPPTICDVEFVDWDGTLLKSESVYHGSAATAPDDPDNKTGGYFIGWDVDFSEITDDLTVTALYERIPVTFININATPLVTVLCNVIMKINPEKGIYVLYAGSIPEEVSVIL